MAVRPQQLLMHIAFDRSNRLPRRVYYFEYRGFRFKSIESRTPKYSSVLLTLIPADGSALATMERARRTAGEFLSALGWANQAIVAFGGPAGHPFVPSGYTLRRARCLSFSFPTIPFRGAPHYSGSLSPIPHVETNDQRVALILWREAGSSNKPWLSFLLYWQIMDVGGVGPIAWVDRCHRRSLLRLSSQEVATFSGRKLGPCLNEEFRHALAHIRREHGRRPLDFDTADEGRRFDAAVSVVRQAAARYIEEQLSLTSKARLVRRRPRTFPTFVDASGQALGPL